MGRKQGNGRVSKSLMTCKACQDNECNKCIDILRSIYTDETICTCTRVGHSGEPRDKQILDPEDGTVYAPGLRVTIDGEVIKNEQALG